MRRLSAIRRSLPSSSCSADIEIQTRPVPTRSVCLIVILRDARVSSAKCRAISAWPKYAFGHAERPANQAFGATSNCTQNSPRLEDLPGAYAMPISANLGSMMFSQ